MLRGSPAAKWGAAPSIALTGTTLPSPRLPAPDPVRAQCPHPGAGAPGGNTGRRTPQHWPPSLLCQETLSFSRHTCFAITTLVSKAPSPRRGSSSRCPVSLPPKSVWGKEASPRPPQPEVSCGLQAVQSQVPQRSGTLAGRCPCADRALLSLWRFVFFLRCCLCEPCCPLLLLVLKLQAALSEGRTALLGPVPQWTSSTWGRTRALWPPGGSRPGPTSFSEAPPQGQPVPHSAVTRPHQCLSHPEVGAARATGLRGHRSSHLCLVTSPPSAFVS